MKNLNRIFIGTSLLILLAMFLSLSASSSLALHKEELEGKGVPLSKRETILLSGDDLTRSKSLLREEGDKTKKGLPEYAPGEIIIRFKKEAGAALDRKLSSTTLQTNSTKPEGQSATPLGVGE